MFKLLDTNRFFLPGTNNQYLHLASLQGGFKEYICFANVKDYKIYVEEITGGHLEFIEDEGLARDIVDFLTDNRVLEIGKPLLVDKYWNPTSSKKFFRVQ